MGSPPATRLAGRLRSGGRSAERRPARTERAATAAAAPPIPDERDGLAARRRAAGGARERAGELAEGRIFERVGVCQRSAADASVASRRATPSASGVPGMDVNPEAADASSLRARLLLPPPDAGAIDVACTPDAVTVGVDTQGRAPHAAELADLEVGAAPQV